MQPLPFDLIDALLADYKNSEGPIDEKSLLKQLTKALVERALNAEMSRPPWPFQTCSRYKSC